MSDQLQFAKLLRASSRPHPPKSPASRITSRIYHALIGLWKFLLGVAFTQTFLGAVIVVGWTCRAAQRAVQKSWWRQSGVPREASFSDFVQCSAFHPHLAGWPNWIFQHRLAGRHLRGTVGFRGVFKSLFHSLWLNLKIGAQAVFNTSVLTLPGCALMLFSWYAGWHNSFNKGYEQAVIGPLTGFSGILLFIAAMYYVPLAQIRQASTGDWRSFYHFKTIWQLIRKRWLACLFLALLFAGLSVPVTILKTVPTFFPQINPKLAELSPAEALAFAKAYYFYAAFALFAAFVLLRIVGARIYASALLACVQSGAIPEDALAENEWETLHRLDLLKFSPAPHRHVFVRTVAWLGTRMGRAATGVALFFVWFAFVSQVYVSEFFMKSPYGRGWLNHPLVQLPWFNYIPPALQLEAETLAAAEPPDPRP